MRRVYHPDGNSWHDVPESDVEAWKAAGWRLTKPAHVDDSDALPPGEGYVAPAVAVAESVAPVAPVAPVAASAPVVDVVPAKAPKK